MTLTLQKLIHLQLPGEDSDSDEGDDDQTEEESEKSKPRGLSAAFHKIFSNTKAKNEDESVRRCAVDAIY